MTDHDAEVKFSSGGVGTTVSNVTGSSIKSYSVNQPTNIGILYNATFNNQTFSDTVEISQSTLFNSCIFQEETKIIISGNETTVNFRNCNFGGNVIFELNANTKIFFTANGYSAFSAAGPIQNMYFQSNSTETAIIFDTFFIVDGVTEVNLYFQDSPSYDIDFQSLSFIKSDMSESISYNLHMSLETLNNPQSKVNLPSINSKFRYVKF